MGRHGSRRHHRGASSILHQLALIVALACPIICSAAPSESTDTSSTDIINSGHNNHHQYPQYVHHRRHHHQHHPRPNGPGTDQEQTNDETVVAGPPKVLVGYADSYITKKAALELQDKLRHLNQPVTEEQYNELLQKLVTKPKADPSHPIYNKMYYDYVSDTREQQQKKLDEQKKMKGEDVIDLSDKVKKAHKKHPKKVHSLSAAHHLEHAEEEPQGERRAKRSVPREESDRQIGKRQAGVWTNEFQHQRRRYESQRTFNGPSQIVPVASLDHDFDDHSAYYTRPNNWAAGAPQYRSAYMPSLWSSQRHRFYGPHVEAQRPNNYYLPVAPPPEFTQFIVRPYQPWMSQPIPGVVYNPAFPPKNPRPNGTGLRPVVRPDTNSIADGDKDEDDYVNPNGNIPNRFGGDDDDDDRFVFDVEERTTTTRRPAAAAALRPFTQSPRFPTRRPPPPLIRDSDNEDTEAAINNIFGNNQSPPPTPPSPAFNFNQQQQPRTTTRRPPPPLIRNTDDASFGQSTNHFGSTNIESQNSGRPNPTRAPPARQTPPPPTTTIRPQVVQQQDDGPSRCVWAIVNCCTPENRQVRYSCFERFGCGGAFWDINPCNEDVFDSAVDAADRFVEE